MIPHAKKRHHHHQEKYETRPESKTTKGEPKFSYVRSMHENEERMPAKSEAPHRVNHVTSQQEGLFIECQDEIKENVDKMLEVNGYQKLSMRKNHKGEYVVAIDDLALLLATVISDLDKKDKKIEEIKHDAKKYDRKTIELESKLNLAEKELSLRNSEIKDLQLRYDEAIIRIKELEQQPNRNYSQPSKDEITRKRPPYETETYIKSFSNTLPSPINMTSRPENIPPDSNILTEVFFRFSSENSYKN